MPDFTDCIQERRLRRIDGHRNTQQAHDHVDDAVPQMSLDELQTVVIRTTKLVAMLPIGGDPFRARDKKERRER